MNQVTPFLNRINASESICMFKLDRLMIALKKASIFLRVLAVDGALHKLLQVKYWSLFCSRCAAGFELLEDLLCSS